MSLSKRDFLQVLTAASVAGMGLTRYAEADAATAEQGLYDLPPLGTGTGFVSFLHMTDCHAQLLPIHFREPSVNLGLAGMQGQLLHLVGEQLLKKAGIRPGTNLAHAFTYIDFERAARRYGKVGGFAHLATLVKRLKASRPGALLLDGGDTWQGSATSLWTNAQDMVDACKALGVDVMTGHWEFTYGADRVRELIDGPLAGGAVDAHVGDLCQPRHQFDPFRLLAAAHSSTRQHHQHLHPRSRPGRSNHQQLLCFRRRSGQLHHQC